jgi:hypothetical protein
MALEEVPKGRMFHLDTCASLYFLLDGNCQVGGVLFLPQQHYIFLWLWLFL